MDSCANDRSLRKSVELSHGEFPDADIALGSLLADHGDPAMANLCCAAAWSYFPAPGLATMNWQRSNTLAAIFQPRGNPHNRRNLWPPINLCVTGCSLFSIFRKETIPRSSRSWTPSSPSSLTPRPGYAPWNYALRLKKRFRLQPNLRNNLKCQLPVLPRGRCGAWPGVEKSQDFWTPAT
jgi:hypothetical protein